MRIIRLLSLLVCIVLPGMSSASIIAPWTPPVVRGHSANCWGRSYAFNKSLLPSEIISQRDNILADSIKLVAVVDGKEIIWNKTAFNFLSADQEAAHYETSASADKISAHCLCSTEFDGMTRVDMEIKSPNAIHVDSLDLVIPLKPEYAKLFYHSPTYPWYVWDWPKKRINAGMINQGSLRLPYVFLLWLGDDNRGLQIFSESDEALSPANPDSVFDLTTENNVATLKINLLSNTSISAPWKWTFGFIATPVKPWPSDYSKLHYCHMGEFGIEHNKRPAIVGHPSYLDRISDMGVNYLGFHEWWSDEQSLPRPKRVDELNSLLSACRAKGIRFVPYSGAYMSTRSKEYSSDWDSLPMGDHYQYVRPDNGDVCRITCNNTGYADLLVSSYEKAFKQYGFGGLYIDGITQFIFCTNRKHGCGYIGKDGVVHPTMALWSTRDLMKRLYRLVKSQPQPGILISHTSGIIALPALSFCDFYLDGEHMLSLTKIGDPDYPEGVLRAETSGHNFGIPGTQLPIYGNKVEKERARAICALYDIRWMYYPEYQQDIWKAIDSFDIKGAEWMPYWNIDKLLSYSPSCFKVSAYLKKGRGILCVVANLGKQAATATLTANNEAMGLPENCKLVYKDEASGSISVSMPGNTANIDVRPGTFRMISIQADERIQ